MKRRRDNESIVVVRLTVSEADTNTSAHCNGFQWLFAGQDYTNYDENYADQPDRHDQIKYILNELRQRPHTRRILMSSWNVKDLLKTEHLGSILTILEERN